MVIIALCVAQFAAIRRGQILEARNKMLAARNAALRAEAGYLQVEDPEKAAVLQLRDLDELTWRWKVWLPAGKWHIRYLTRGIPRQGIPNGATAGPIAGGREVLVATTVRKGADDRWLFRGNVEGLQIGNDLDESHRLVAPLIKPEPITGQATDIAGDKVEESFDPQEPIVLIRLRAFDVVQTASGRRETRDDPQSSDGIMVWLYRLP